MRVTVTIPEKVDDRHPVIVEVDPIEFPTLEAAMSWITTVEGDPR